MNWWDSFDKNKYILWYDEFFLIIIIDVNISDEYLEIVQFY